MRIASSSGSSESSSFYSDLSWNKDSGSQISGEFYQSQSNEVSSESPPAFCTSRKRIKQIFKESHEELYKPDPNKEKIANNFLEGQEILRQLKKRYEKDFDIPKYKEDFKSLNISTSLLQLSQFEEDKVVLSPPTASDIEKALQELYDLENPDIEKNAVQTYRQNISSDFNLYSTSGLLDLIQAECTPIRSKSSLTSGNSTEFPKKNSIKKTKELKETSYSIPIHTPKTAVSPPTETPPTISFLGPFGSFSVQAGGDGPKKTEKKGSSPNRSPRTGRGSGSSPRLENLASLFKKFPSDESSSSIVPKNCNFEISPEKKFFYATSSCSNTTWDHWLKYIQHILDSTTKITGVINPSKTKNITGIPSNLTNHYAIKAIEPISISELHHHNPSLRCGLFKFQTIDEHYKSTEIAMDPESLAPVILDKESNRIFPSDEEILMCDSIATPQQTHHEHIKELNNVAVLTSGCGLGKLPHEAAQYASKKILKEFEKLSTNFSTKKLTPALVFLKQLEAIRKADKGLKKNKQKYGATEATIASIIGEDLIVSTIGNIKTFILEKTKDGLNCFELRDPTYPTINGFIGNTSQREGHERINQVSCAVFNLKEGDYKIILCSKGVYDNLDPIILKTHSIEHLGEKNEINIHRSMLMADRLKNILSFYKNDNANNGGTNENYCLMHPLQKYLATLSFNEWKRVLEGSYKKVLETNLRSESSSEETGESVVNTNKKVELSWENLFIDATGKPVTGKPGFSAFAIMS